jgi:hypothetical protein
MRIQTPQTLAHGVFPTPGGNAIDDRLKGRLDGVARTDNEIGGAQAGDRHVDKVNRGANHLVLHPMLDDSLIRTKRQIPGFVQRSRRQVNPGRHFRQCRFYAGAMQKRHGFPTLFQAVVVFLQKVCAAARI